MKTSELKENKCSHCGQSTYYLLRIDKGTVNIVKQIARFIGQKGINAVHPRKELEGKWLTSNEVGNLSRPRMHGLIAKVEGNAGNYCLTAKGIAFLNGEEIPRTAIRSITDEQTIGYLEEDGKVTISKIDSEYWNGIGYEIREGRVITKEEMSHKVGGSVEQNKLL